MAKKPHITATSLKDLDSAADTLHDVLLTIIEACQDRRIDLSTPEVEQWADDQEVLDRALRACLLLAREGADAAIQLRSVAKHRDNELTLYKLQAKRRKPR